MCGQDNSNHLFTCLRRLIYNNELSLSVSCSSLSDSYQGRRGSKASLLKTHRRTGSDSSTWSSFEDDSDSLRRFALSNSMLSLNLAGLPVLTAEALQPPTDKNLSTNKNTGSDKLTNQVTEYKPLHVEELIKSVHLPNTALKKSLRKSYKKFKPGKSKTDD